MPATTNDAESRARRLYPDHPGFQRAYLKGAEAAIAGDGVEACPYRRQGWKAWRQAWLAGHASEAGEEE
jgi:ribosome modulation factor